MKLIYLLTALAVALASPALAADKGGLIPQSLIPAFDESPGPMTVWSGPYIEVGAGLNVSNVDIGEVGGGDVLTLGDSAWAGHIGVGYDKVLIPQWLFGVWGRVELDDISYAVAGEKLADTAYIYSLGGRVGFIPREDAMIYALLGYSFSDLDFNSDISADKSRNAWVVGGGLELMLTDHVGLGAEYSARLYDEENVEDAELDIVDHAVKARLLYKF